MSSGEFSIEKFVDEYDSAFLKEYMELVREDYESLGDVVLARFARGNVLMQYQKPKVHFKSDFDRLLGLENTI